MKIWLGIVTAVFSASILSLAGCGGGGSNVAVSSIIPKGDYYSIAGVNPAAKYNSDIFEKIADDNDRWGKEKEEADDLADDMEIKLKQHVAIVTFRSTDARETLSYHAGPFDEDDLEDYFKDQLNWDDLDEEEEQDQVYYTGKVGDVEKAYMLVSSGVLYGQIDAVEDSIDVMKKGKKKLTDIKDYQEAQSLVDFGATEYSLQWDNMDPVRAHFKRMMRQVDDDEDLMDAIDRLEATGTSINYGDDLQITAKFKFKKDKYAETIEEFLEDNLDDIFDKLGPMVFRDVFNQQVKGRDVEDLADEADVSRSGSVVEVRMQFSYDDLLSACGGDFASVSPEDQITATVAELTAAIKTGDFEKVKSLVTKDYEQFGGEEDFKAAAALMKDLTIEVSDIEVDGNTAIAKMKITMTILGEEQTAESPATFRLEDGKWKVAPDKPAEPEELAEPAEPEEQ